MKIFYLSQLNGRHLICNHEVYWGIPKAHESGGYVGGSYRIRSRFFLTGSLEKRVVLRGEQVGFQIFEIFSKRQP